MINYEVNPHKLSTYKGNINVKADQVEQPWTRYEIEEYKKCRNDPIYFVQNYVKIISLDEGLVKFKMYDYQKRMFNAFEDNRFNVVLSSRQSGKSITMIAYILWYGLFHSEKTIALLANKHSTAKELLGRLTLMLENIPFFLQPGCKALNKSFVEFSNNSKIISASSASGSIRGYTVDLLVLDEFAFAPRATEFYTSTYPVITSGTKSRVLITSTANGVGNQFHNIWEGAVQGTNEYNPIRIDWWDVPGRDEKWKKETIRNTSQLQFDQEFGNCFLGTGDTLIDAETLLQLRSVEPIRYLEKGDFLIYEEVKKDHQYIMLVDVAKGVNKNYSTFNIIDITTEKFKQVAVYRNNKISAYLFPTIIKKYGMVYNEAYVVIESNDQGILVCQGLYNDLEYENMHLESVVKGKMGIPMNVRTKRIGCSGFKSILESGTLEVYDKETIKEISTFEAKGRSYEASDGNNDDLVMNLVMLGYFISTTKFTELTDIDIAKMMYNQKMEEIENDIPPFGFIEDGLDTPIPEANNPWGSFDYDEFKENVYLEVENWEL